MYNYTCSLAPVAALRSASRLSDGSVMSSLGVPRALLLGAASPQSAAAAANRAHSSASDCALVAAAAVGDKTVTLE